MRHGKSERTLGRNPGQRKALLRGLVCSLLDNERIETTLAKAKEVRPVSEKIISLGLQGTLHSRRRAFAFINKRATVDKLFNDIAKRFDNPQGGYTRIVKTRQRKGDGAVMAVIELTKLDLSKKAGKPPEAEETKTEE